MIIWQQSGWKTRVGREFKNGSQRQKQWLWAPDRWGKSFQTILGKTTWGRGVHSTAYKVLIYWTSIKKFHLWKAMLQTQVPRPQSSPSLPFSGMSHFCQCVARRECIGFPRCVGSARPLLCAVCVKIGKFLGVWKSTMTRGGTHLGDQKQGCLVYWQYGKFK